MWRVFFTDTFDGTRWSEEFLTEEAARNRARYSGEMVRAVIENPKGQRVN